MLPALHNEERAHANPVTCCLRSTSRSNVPTCVRHACKSQELRGGLLKRRFACPSTLRQALRPFDKPFDRLRGASGGARLRGASGQARSRCSAARYFSFYLFAQRARGFFALRAKKRKTGYPLGER